MGLKYSLVENRLTADPDDCAARVQDVPVVGLDQLIKNMTSRGLTLTDTEILGVFNELGYVINDALQQGYAVHTPFVKIRPSIVGVFSNRDDSFDASRHSVKFNANLGGNIKIDQKAIRTEKVQNVASKPEIFNVRDFQTQGVNESISLGGTAEIVGSNLKIDTDDPEQGIFFVTDTGETRVDIYVHNKPSLVIFQVPADLPGGEVRISVRNKLVAGNILRQDTLEVTLTVL